MVGSRDVGRPVVGDFVGCFVVGRPVVGVCVGFLVVGLVVGFPVCTKI